MFLRIFIISLIYTTILFATDNFLERGIPFFSSYSPKDYKAGPQNFSIAQDSSGLIYAVNNDGILIFDGNSWNLFSLPDDIDPRIIAAGHDGKIYLGAYGSFGYLNADKSGNIKYVSLSDTVSPGFNYIWDIQHTSNATFFMAGEYFFWYDGKTLKKWYVEKRINQILPVGDDLFVGAYRNNEVYKLRNDSLIIHFENDFFKNFTPNGLLPLNNDTNDPLFLAMSYYDGLKLVSKKNKTTIPNEENNYISIIGP